MKKSFRNILTAALAVMMILVMVSCATVEKDVNTAKGKWAGRTVILHDNDVHGAIDGYAKMAYLKQQFEKEGATVIIVSVGDFSQGTLYVGLEKGINGVKMMNAVGYDLVTLGNHEFDFGYEQLKNNLDEAAFQVLCSDIFYKGKTIYKPSTIVKVGDLKLGFFALTTPETQTKVNPGLIQGLDFASSDTTIEHKYDLYEVAQKEIDKLSKKADLIFCISHLGVDLESIENGCASYNVLNNTTGIDFMMDGHSNTVMTKGENKEPIQNTGISFENIGVIVIDNASKRIEDNFLIKCDSIGDDPAILALVQQFKKKVDDEYNHVFATTEVFLDGSKEANRTMESSLGDLIADSMVWSVLQAGSTAVADDHVVAITNGGGIRATINVGDVTKAMVNTVLPFGNTIAVDYVKGTELLESLEASTYCTPGKVGGFPQVAGIKFTVNTKIPYDQGALYEGSTYYAPKSIKRVTIDSINGKAFNPDDTYAVITNNFCAAGGDTYYALKRAYDAGNGFDTAITLDVALMDYIQEVLGGNIGKEYEKPQGRITIVQ